MVEIFGTPIDNEYLIFSGVAITAAVLLLLVVLMMGSRSSD